MSVLTGFAGGTPITAHGAYATEESVHLAIRPELYSEMELVCPWTRDIGIQI